MSSISKEIPQSGFMREDKIGKAGFTALQPTPALKYPVKYLTTVSVVAQRGMSVVYSNTQ